MLYVQGLAWSCYVSWTKPTSIIVALYLYQYMCLQAEYTSNRVCQQGSSFKFGIIAVWQVRLHVVRT